MDNQPSFDRSILIPIVLSGFSVIGIIAVLLIGRALNAPAEIPVTPSATRFSYVYLGTEPVITTPLTEETEVESTEPPAVEPEGTTPAPVTPTRGTPPTLIILGSPTPNPQATNTLSPTPTQTSAAGPALNPGIYDDIDSHLIYSGSWAESAVPGAYRNTLHVSDNPGPPASTVSFSFIGRQLRLTYQGGSTLGQIRVSIDNNPGVTVDQSGGTTWASDLLSLGTHSVLITHTGGGSVNLDQVTIPDPINTPTPTPTRTATQNS
jgi:hypothetical protein